MMVPLTMAVMARHAPAVAGVAAGLISTAQQIGGAVGLALAATAAGGSGGIGRAFLVGALIIGGAALVALLLPGKTGTPAPAPTPVAGAPVPR